MKLSILIPCYSGKISHALSHALVQEMILAQQVECQLTVTYLPGMSLVHSARNILADLFLNDPERPDKAVFVDDDVSWQPGNLIQLAMNPVDIVAGGCRRKKDPEGYAINWLPTGITQDPETKLIEIETIGMAFAALSRRSLEAFREKTPEMSYRFEGMTLHGFFDCPIKDGRLVGEDVSFCEKFRALGGKIWLDPRFTITHWDGLRGYEGHVGHWLNRQVTPEKAA